MTTRRLLATLTVTLALILAGAAAADGSYDASGTMRVAVARASAFTEGVVFDCPAELVAGLERPERPLFMTCVDATDTPYSTADLRLFALHGLDATEGMMRLEAWRRSEEMLSWQTAYALVREGEALMITVWQSSTDARVRLITYIAWPAG